MPSLAERTRDAVDARPFLRTALAAGVVNYAAAARLLDVEGEQDAVATALRRYADDLTHEAAGADATVRIESGLGASDTGVLAVNDTAYASGAGSLTGVVATGSVDARAVAAVLGRLDAAGINPEAAGYTDNSLVVVVERRDGPNALRAVEGALDAVSRVRA
ncbi:hypothetical protein [Salarchaeum sp. JOR-1]|uniref:DUF7523 family protein n=1 Tax=Salarchaeum sp. JOR-1 TaxID=2599399 RepID=UPI0011986B15|nr:hypothetical protein [Salarchaeum sp. JOR-1]QDX41280.1 hypothetical protein FQU85_10365 [Salarchaeum sp. JOR-1]